MSLSLGFGRDFVYALPGLSAGLARSSISGLSLSTASAASFREPQHAVAPHIARPFIECLEAGPVARLYSFWYEQNAFNDRLSVRAGLMSADSQFLQSRTATNFINNAISWPTFLAANLPAGGPAYPLPAPGVRVRIKPADEWAFQAIDTGEETFDNSLVMFNAGKISWKTAGAAGRHQPL